MGRAWGWRDGEGAGLTPLNAWFSTAFVWSVSAGGDMRSLEVWYSHLAAEGAEVMAWMLALNEDLRPLAGLA